MSFGKLIREIRREIDISQEKMAEQLQPFLPNYDLSKGTVSSWESKSEATVKDVIDAYVHAFPQHEAKLRGLNVGGNGTRVDNPPGTVSRTIPFLGAVAIAGFDIIGDNSPVSTAVHMINPGTFFRNAEGALQITGHSMFPKYPSGCIIAYRAASKDRILWGEDYVVELQEDKRLILKRIEKSETKGCIKLVSYNVNKDSKYMYDPIHYPLNDVGRIFMVLGMIQLEAMQA